MSINNKTIGLILTLAGLIVVIIGVISYVWHTIGLDLIPAVMIMAVGLIVLALGVLSMYGFINLCGSSSVEKNENSSKAQARSDKKRSSDSGNNRAASVNLGDTDLAKAIKFAAGKIDTKVSEGKISDAQADVYMERVMSYAPEVGKNEDAALVAVSQVIGSIVEA